MKRFYINSSELAACIGRHKYKDRSELVISHIKRYNPGAYFKMQIQDGVATNHDMVRQAEQDMKAKAPELAKMIDERVKATIEEASKRNEDYSKVVASALESVTQSITQNADLDENTKHVLVEESRKRVYTNHGIKNEQKVIDKVAIDSKCRVIRDGVCNLRSRYLVDAYTPDGKKVEVYINGVIDGLQVGDDGEKCIVEVKNRMNRLFNCVVEYERIQVLAYMYILDIEKAKLVEHFQGTSREYDIAWDDSDWIDIVHGARNFAIKVLQACSVDAYIKN